MCKAIKKSQNPTTYWDIEKNGKREPYEFTTIEEGKNYFSELLEEAEYITFIETDEEENILSKEEVLVKPIKFEEFSKFGHAEYGIKTNNQY